MVSVIFIILFSSSVFALEAGNIEPAVSFLSRLEFFLILVPAAIWDSINPCAFAVMIILLSAILKEQKSKKAVLWAGALFVFSIFISYTAMWIGVYSALANNSNTFYLKLIVWVIWILVWVANLKDYFWYGKGFRMEVPDAWRSKMKKVLRKATSPLWAFFVWFLISLFLLPCTSWPYITVLGYLSADSPNINVWWYIYIVVYNLIFIIPMVIIGLIIGLGIKDVPEMMEYKELNVERVHLITGLIMFALWVYILSDILI